MNGLLIVCMWLSRRNSNNKLCMHQKSAKVNGSIFSDCLFLAINLRIQHALMTMMMMKHKRQDSKRGKKADEGKKK